MDPHLTRSVAVLLLLVGPVVIGVVTAETDDWQAADIDRMLLQEPRGEQVVVTGAVTATPEMYTADSGNTYQRFHVSDGDGELLVFCSTADGRITTDVGERIRVPGTVQKRYGSLQIYTSCADIT